MPIFKAMKNMLLVVPAFALALNALPVLAQDAPAEDGPSLMERGLSMFLDGFRQEMEPALGEMSEMLHKFGPAIAPAMERMLELVDDMTNYELPEMLDNGDIIIRRKPDAPTVEPPADEGVEL